mmetsp:Transcript_5071/g.14965  ORF Transcript_5071/g.14965 Transcript_5071/m.14965 type:complete len:439 (-) Transcript_5071:21-1337(-)
MAAPDAKTSPSQKEVQQQQPQEAPAVAKEAAATQQQQPLPTYEASEASDKYVLAKSLLGSGDFEQALELIEEAIQEYRAILLSHDMDPETSDLHESLGPWHYLYGTTLLYSIEESNDTQMTVGQQQGNEQEEDSPEQQATGGVDVEDMEIAWENLDTARQTVQLMMASNETMPEDRKTKLQLDLAQILLREGDLQRLNGRYLEAIGDYEASLKLRQEFMGPFDRKVADGQYNLGLSYLSNSSELQKVENPTAENLKLSQEHCQKGVKLYLDCARTLCGQIASLCATEPSTILDCKPDSVAGLKTTGMDEAALATSDASQTLKAWRSKVATMTPVEADDPRLADLKELLDEIQETIDEAEQSQQAVREAVQLKLNAQKAVVESEDGSTTQIGFGQPTLTAAAAAPAAAAAQPMMVVKKKKKRESDDTGEGGDAKRAKAE